MKSQFFLALIFLSIPLFSQTIVTTVPVYPTQTDNITLTFDVSKTSMAGYHGNVYVHTGVYIGTSTSWQKVIGSWGNNSTQPLLTNIGTDKYQFTINNPRNYYGVTDLSQVITTLCFVVRSSDAAKQTEDIHLALYSAGLKLVVSSPVVTTSFGDPLRSPVFISSGGTLQISAGTSEIGTKTKSIDLWVNGTVKAHSATNSLNYTFNSAQFPKALDTVKIIAADTANLKDSTQFIVMRNPAVKNTTLPSGNRIGINYGSDNRSATLAIYAPYKKFMYIIGDFNDWKVDTTYFMNRDMSTSDSLWWVTIPNLTPAKEYGFQYLMDGLLRIQEAYAEKILDPDNDKSITPAVTPAYPTGKTSSIVSVLQTAQPQYTWKVDKFTRTSKDTFWRTNAYERSRLISRPVYRSNDHRRIRSYDPGRILRRHECL